MIVTKPKISNSAGCMLLYRLGWKFDFDDDTIIISKVTSRIINFVIQDMGWVALMERC
jgi:hypothetical protein